MKKSILLILIIVSSASAQKKYQSLLWEISGNGLTKPSYLYGSMHVSEKVSYHLSDAFFKHLLAADFIANESDPTSWIGIYDVMNNPYNDDSAKFYSRFYQKPIEKAQLYPLFVSNNHTLNNILFRTNDLQKDYQEDTYLDMFIHQTGKKYKKQTIGLEDAKTSMISIMNIETDQMRPNEENMQAIMKLLKEKSFNQALLDYYRDKNLDMIDSIYTLIAPANYLKTMLYDRNVVMTNSIDSIARKGSLFAAIGAAHLPGNKGVIESLRKRGFTVTPVIDSYTEKGKNAKKQIDGYFIKPVFESHTTADGMITLPMLSTPIYSGENISTPDLSNGGTINLKRIPLRNYLRKDNRAFDHKTIDSLFYENIPGEIIAKRYFTDDNYVGYDISSRTTTGNAQRYRYYITPLEIICVSMSGQGDYVRLYENEVFSNIRIRKSTADWQTLAPLKGGYSVEIPEYHSLYGNRDSSNPADTEITAFDSAENASYFLTERTLNDNENPADTAFELERMHDEYYTQHDAVKILGQISAEGYESIATIGSKKICLKSVVSGQKYYLLGTVDGSATNTLRFFKSFHLLPYKYSPVRRLTDSSAYFGIEIPAKQNEKLFWREPAKKKVWDKNAKENSFVGKTDHYNFTSASGSTVELKFLQYHRYATEQNIDSVWAYYRHNIRKDYDYDDSTYVENPDSEITLEHPEMYSKKGFKRSTWDKLVGDAAANQAAITLASEKITFNSAQQYHQLDVVATSINSSQAIRHRIIFKNGLTYWLKALVDKNKPNGDSFVEATFNSFHIVNPPETPSVFDDRIDMFLNDAASANDSIRYSALASVYMLKPTLTDVDKMIDFVSNFNFTTEELQSKADLLETIGGIKSPLVLNFLEDQYKIAGSNTVLQFSILRALANQQSKPGYKKILELLEHDFPLSDNRYEIQELFDYFEEDLHNSQVLYPRIFQFYTIEEYHNPIIRFATLLFEKNMITQADLAGYKKLILTDAKLEYKRISGWKAKTQAVNSESAPFGELLNYLSIINRFKKDSDTKDLLLKIKNLNIGEINLELARLQVVNHKTIDPQSQDRLLRDPSTAFAALQLFENAKIIHPGQNWTDDQIAEAAMVHFYKLDVADQKMTLAQKITKEIGGKPVTYYFFRIQTKADPEAMDYGTTPEMIAGIAFVDGKDSINQAAFKSLPAQPVNSDEQLQNQIESMIDASINEDKIRATFGKKAGSLMLNAYDY